MLEETPLNPSKFLEVEQNNCGYFGGSVGDATAPGGDGFAAGDCAPPGEGKGSTSGFTLREGSGTAGAFLLALAFTVGVSPAASRGVGETAALAFRFEFVFTFAAGLIVPPDGIPSSLLPDAGCTDCTGWLLGSAASVDWGWFAFVELPDSEFRVKA